jgi:two-component system sensor histidine kinase/response regulator
VESQIDPSADGLRIGALRSVNGVSAAAGNVSKEPAPGTDYRITLVMGARDSPTKVSTLRSGTLAVTAFQVGYTLLDRIEYPLSFARTAPLHIAGMVVGIVAFMTTMSPRAMQNWRFIALATCTAVIASSAWIAVIESDSDVLVTSILMFFFAAGALVSWSPRWQAALAASGATGLFWYSRFTADPNRHIAIAWTMVLSAAILSQLSSVRGVRYRQKLAEHLTALAENGRMLRREMDLSAEVAAARGRDLVLLQASEAMLRTFFAASPDNIAVNSLTDGRFIAVNDDYLVAGYTRDDVMASSVIALRMWPSAEDMSKFIATIQQVGRVKNMEIRQRRKDGTIEIYLISASVVEVKGEQCVISMTRDITEIKRVETRLLASHVALRKVFDATLDVIVVTRLSDGKSIDFNQQFERLGYGQKDLDEWSAGKGQIWANEAQHRKYRERVATDGIVRNIEADFNLPGGGQMPALVSAVRIELEGEECVVTMARDLTAAKQASRTLEESMKALRASEQTLRRLFDANLDSMTLNGVDGIYIDVNQEFCRATGFTREEAVGHHFSELNMWIHPEEMIAFSDQLFSTNEVRNLEIVFRCKDGAERTALISAVNLELQGQLCCLTISREISDLKLTQRELVGAREAALAASRAKSEFLSSMSHEIRTPMNAILGMAELLMETELGDEQRRYLSTVISNSYALLELINSILDLAKVESGRLSLEMVEFNLKDVTEKALETLAIRAHERGLELMVRFAPEVPEFALGDPLRLGQILINLIGNAIKFTHKGQVLVSVERDAASTDAGAVKFTVTDTGIGISADKIHLLFDAFSQADSSTSRKYGGSGLGLAIVSRLVALMHGKVAVTSEPGNGSAFSFTAQFGVANTTQSMQRIRAVDAISILLVDDNAESRSIISELLSADGAHVTQVSSGKQALAELRRGAFQIILLDNTMPAQRGFDIAKQLVKGGYDPLQIVMMLCTNDLSSEFARLRAIGVDNYIVKPVRRAELFAAVELASGREQIEPRRSELARQTIAPPSSRPAIVERPLEILIADDSPDNRALIRAYLKNTPYRLEEAADGEEAVNKFIAGKFDLVLMDIQMPIVDGYEAASTIRGWERANNRRRTPIVALTASALEEAVHRSKSAGCDTHVTKPVKKSTLLHAIRDAIEVNELNIERAKVADIKEEMCRTW